MSDPFSGLDSSVEPLTLLGNLSSDAQTELSHVVMSSLEELVAPSTSHDTPSLAHPRLYKSLQEPVDLMALRNTTMHSHTVVDLLSVSVPSNTKAVLGKKRTRSYHAQQWPTLK